MPNVQTDYLPYLLIAAMVLIGGLVAFVADSLGRRIGKKRLSFMGLRPRYTATLITVGAGVLIPLLTILAIYVLSSDVREWIRKGRTAIYEAQRSEKRVKDLQNQITVQKDQTEILTANTKRLTEQTKHLTAQLKTVRETLKKTNDLAAKAEKTVSLAQARVHAIQGQLDIKNRQIAAKEKDLLKTQDQLKKGRVALNQLRQTYQVSATQLTEIKAQALTLDHQNQEFEKTIAQLKGELSGLKSQKEQYQSQIDGLKESIGAYQDSIHDLTSRINELQGQRDRLSSYLADSIVISRTRPLIFDASEELARIQLPPSLSPVAARNAYFDLLQRARTVATQHKAGGVPSATLREQNLVNPPRHISVAEQEEAIIRGLTSQRNELVFIARAAGNTFEGEVVLLDFVAYRNRIVYAPGKLIAETKVDGRKSEVEILNSITQFIQQDLRARALADGMIPPSGRTSTLGVVSNDEMLSLIHQIKETNQMIRLQALAKDETKAGDQIELTFRVRY